MTQITDVQVSPVQAGSVREDLEDVVVQQRPLLEPCQLLSELQLQTVTSPVLPFQMLDGPDAPVEEVSRTSEGQDPENQTSMDVETHLSWPETMIATRSHTASASSM